MNKIYKLFVLLFFILITSCNGININKYLESQTNIDSTLIGKYKTEYSIHYNSGVVKYHTIYSDNEIYTCSYQGTNFLLEKDNTNEILSTTAPIEIVKSEIVK